MAQLAPQPQILELQHFDLHYDKRWYCGHPRQGIYACFDGTEIIVGHNHALCAYKEKMDVRHDFGGYHSRAEMFLQRSTDAGKTWPKAADLVVFDEKMSDQQKLKFLAAADGVYSLSTGIRNEGYQVKTPRENYDMFDPNSVFFFGRTYLQERGKVPVAFALRSPDRGKTWEKVPTLITHPDGPNYRIHKDCHPVVRMLDGKTLLAAMSVQSVDEAGKALPSVKGGVVIYASTDHGLTWKIRSSVTEDSKFGGRFTYAGLLLRPDGELHAYYLHITPETQAVAGVTNAVCLSVSKDGGKTWSEPKPIVGKGNAIWKNPGDKGNLYRSPWAMQLDDGRIVVLFGRRRLPMGIGGVVSADGGKTWSEEFVLRDDGLVFDLGYVVGSQLKDGRIFAAYYFTRRDGNKFDGTRYLAGTTLKLR